MMFMMKMRLMTNAVTSSASTAERTETYSGSIRSMDWKYSITLIGIKTELAATSVCPTFRLLPENADHGKAQCVNGNRLTDGGSRSVEEFLGQRFGEQANLCPPCYIVGVEESPGRDFQVAYGLVFRA